MYEYQRAAECVSLGSPSTSESGAMGRIIVCERPRLKKLKLITVLERIPEYNASCGFLSQNRNCDQRYMTLVTGKIFPLRPPGTSTRLTAL
jgi:hypothetical protein